MPSINAADYPTAMANYIDGFVLPIPRNRLDEYRQVADSVADIWKEHGALNYYEFVGDDMNREGTRAFTDLASASQDEVIVFGFVEFDSRETRDRVNQKVESDPRMTDLVTPLLDAGVFDAQRMAYGGFKLLVRSSRRDT